MASLYLTVRKNGVLVAEDWEDLPSNWEDLDQEERDDWCSDQEQNFLDETLTVHSNLVEEEGKRQ